MLEKSLSKSRQPFLDSSTLVISCKHSCSKVSSVISTSWLLLTVGVTDIEPSMIKQRTFLVISRISAYYSFPTLLCEWWVVLPPVVLWLLCCFKNSSMPLTSSSCSRCSKNLCMPLSISAGFFLKSTGNVSLFLHSCPCNIFDRSRVKNSTSS